MFIKKSVKVFVLVVLVLALSGFTYAFAATNTVVESKAGDGSKLISGYVVTAVKYTLVTGDPTKIASVEFTISPAAGFVTIRVKDGGAWYTCTGTNSISCTTAIAGVNATVFDADLLQVVATD